MSSEFISVGTRLLSRPGAPGEPAGLPQSAGGPHPEPGIASAWAESIPPGQDGTLLAIVPIPGTGTSLAIVGYAIASTDRAETISGRAETISGRAETISGHAATTTGYAGTAAERQADSGLLLDHAQRRVWAGEREVPLTFQEFELLAFLSAHPATVFSRADLIELVWHRNPGRDARAVARDSRTVDVHVSRIRQKLGLRYGQCVVTEYRVGYQFRPRPA